MTVTELKERATNAKSRVDTLRSAQTDLLGDIETAADAARNGDVAGATLASVAQQKSAVDRQLVEAEQELQAAERLLAHETAVEQRAELESCFRELAKISGGEFENLYLRTCLAAGRFFQVQQRAVTLLNALRVLEPLGLDMHGDDQKLSRHQLRDPRPKLMDRYRGVTNRGWDFAIPLVPLIEKF